MNNKKKALLSGNKYDFNKELEGYVRSYKFTKVTQMYPIVFSGEIIYSAIIEYGD